MKKNQKVAKDIDRKRHQQQRNKTKQKWNKDIQAWKDLSSSDHRQPERVKVPVIREYEHKISRSPIVKHDDRDQLTDIQTN